MSVSLGTAFRGLSGPRVTPASRRGSDGDAAVTVAPDDPGMGTTRPSAMCVVVVDDGPGDVRWALVSVNPDPVRDPAAVERRRHRDAAGVLAQVSEFLTAAGLQGGPEPPDHPDPRDPP
jgi:hypothetical protein